MNSNQLNSKSSEDAKLLVAMHSSSENFGVAVMNSENPEGSLRHETFPLGKNLSNNIFSSIFNLIPKSNWKCISRIAVATGPGSYTGTRLSVVLCRTLAQQLNCQLDGISSFALMAPRLSLKLPNDKKEGPFWIIKKLNRRGIIAGKYQIYRDNESPNSYSVSEISKPKLLNSCDSLNPNILVEEDVTNDVIRLLEICLDGHIKGQTSEWIQVHPIYPTSPVR